MEHQKLLNLLNEASDSRFVTRKWSIINDQSNANYDVGNEIIYNTKVLKFLWLQWCLHFSKGWYRHHSK